MSLAQAPVGPDKGLMQRHQGGMDGYRDDRQMEVVKHDIDMLVDASLKA